MEGYAPYSLRVVRECRRATSLRRDNKRNIQNNLQHLRSLCVSMNLPHAWYGQSDKVDRQYAVGLQTYEKG